MKRRLFILVWLLQAVHPAWAGGSLNYTLTLQATGSAGVRAASADCTVDFSDTPGAALQSADYRARSGFSGQLYDFTALRISAHPAPPIPETGPSQLGATLLLDDATTLPVPAAGIAWSILSGPVSGISADGLLTASAVYEDTAASILGGAAGLTGTFSFTVTESIPDNFPGYAADGLPDSWQARYFLPPGRPTAGQEADFDHDSLGNLLEFAFGTDPADAASGPGPILFSSGVITQRGQPTVLVRNIPGGVDFRAVFGRRKDYSATGLTYRAQFSANLITWINSAATPVVIASDGEIDAVTVPYPFFINGAKARFFRIAISGPTPP
ncbi:MAG: hypothetical protein V4726_25165 [Verrucomicrobiota bacterium]